VPFLLNISYISVTNCSFTNWSLHMGKKTAIREDAAEKVEAADVNETTGTPGKEGKDGYVPTFRDDARQEALQSILSARRSEIEQETGVTLGTAPEKTEEAVDATEDEVKPEEQTKEEVSEQAELQTEEVKEVKEVEEDKVEDKPPQKLKIKIDGEEEEITLDEAVRIVQKNRAADKRLAEASRLLKEAQEKSVTDDAQKKATESAKEDEKRKETLKDLNKKFVAAMLEGDEGKAADVNLEIQSLLIEGRPEPTPKEPAVDVGQIASQVKQQLEVESALKKSKIDYPELYKDPDLEAVAAAKIERMMKDEEQSFSDALETVAKEFSTKFGWKAGRKPETQESTTSRSQKLEKKAGIDVLPAASARAVSTTPEPLTPSQRIEQMRKARPGASA